MIELNLKSRICIGGDAINALSELKGLNVAIITDSFLNKSGKADLLIEKMPECKVSVFDKIAPDPSIEQVRATYEFVCNNNADVMIAFGGGSAIDTAKAVILVGREAGKGILRLIAIPTTSGTGSEVTKFTVISDVESGVKYPLIDDDILPELAILDHTLTMTVPPAVTAATGMDVLTHAIEAYVCKDANHVSDSLAEKAIVLTHENLFEAYKNGDNEYAREAMQSASYLAGVSFNAVGLGITHSIAHALGANFHIPHGAANAMVLPHVIAFNASLDVPFGVDKSETAKRYAVVAERMGLGKVGTRLAVQYLIKEINKMLTDMKLHKTLMQYGVKRDTYLACKQKMIDSAMKDICTVCNPRKPSAEDIAQILDNLFDGGNARW